MREGATGQAIASSAVRTMILPGAQRWEAVGPVWRELLVDHAPRSVFQMAEWAEALTRHSIMDTTKAKRELGWSPGYTGLDALRDTLRRGPNGA